MEPTPVNDVNQREVGKDDGDVGRLVDSLLRDLRRLIRSSLALRALSLLAAAALGLAVVSFVVDRAFRLPVAGRAVALSIYGVAFSWLAWRLFIRPWRVTLSDRILADLIEKRFPEMQDRFRSAVEFRDDPGVLHG